MDKSLMIKLTPEEIKNIMRLFSLQWQQALNNNTTKTIEEVCDFYYNLAFDMLLQTDPDRFIYEN